MKTKYFLSDLKQPFYLAHIFCESRIETEASEDSLSLLHNVWRCSWKDSKLEANVSMLLFFFLQVTWQKIFLEGVSCSGAFKS